jgi:hypothetical protein
MCNYGNGPTGTWLDGCYDGAETAALVVAIATMVAVFYGLRGWRTSDDSRNRRRFWALVIALVVIQTNTYHLLFGEPWAHELDHDYLVVINSREYTVPTVAVAAAVAWAVITRRVCCGLCDIFNPCGLAFGVAGAFMVTAAVIAVAAAPMAKHRNAEAYAHATDSIGLLAGLAGAVAATTAMTAEAAIV